MVDICGGHYDGYRDIPNSENSRCFPMLRLGMGVENDPKMKSFKMVPNGPQTCLMTILTHFVCCITLELPKIELEVGDK